MRARLQRLVPYAFVALALGAAVFAVARDWHRLTTEISRLAPASLLGSWLAGVLAIVLTYLMWRELLHGLGALVPYGESARVFFVSQLGKYLPGSAWPVLAQMEYGRRTGTPRTTMLAANLLAIAVGVATGLVVAGAVLPFAAPDAVGQFWWAFACIPLVLGALHPAVLPGVLNWAAARIGRDVRIMRVTWSGLIRAVAWGFASWVAYGVHMWILARALGGAGWPVVAVSVGGFALATCAGILFLPAPAGAGVRDPILIATLGLQLGSAAALAGGLVSRVELVLADLVVAGAAAAAGARRLFTDAASTADGD